MRTQEVQKRQLAVLIGACSEGLEIARAITLQLRGAARVGIWTGGAPVLIRSEMDSLTEILATTDFAILVHSWGELLIRDPGRERRRMPKKRGETPVRNVLFGPEFLMKHLSPSRIFVVYDDAFPPRVTIESISVTVTWFDGFSNEGLVSAVGPVCSMIRQEMRKIGPR